MKKMQIISLFALFLIVLCFNGCGPDYGSMRWIYLQNEPELALEFVKDRENNAVIGYANNDIYIVNVDGKPKKARHFPYKNGKDALVFFSELKPGVHSFEVKYISYDNSKKLTYRSTVNKVVHAELEAGHVYLLYARRDPVNMYGKFRWKVKIYDKTTRRIIVEQY